MADAPPDPHAEFAASAEPLLAEALLALEQRGEPGLQEFLGAHPTHAEDIRVGLERLRRLGVLAPPPAAPVAPQQFGEFRVLRKLGAGGMGVVYLAEQTSLQRKVALKVVRPELLLSPTARERFQREVEAVARLHHPGIVPILAVGDEGGQPWFAMEYVEGKSLEELLASLQGQDPARTSGNALRSAFGAQLRPGSGASGAFVASYWETCVRLVLQVAQTMVHVHERGIVHRDLKPSNVVVTPHGQALVLDFGLAHVQDLQRVTRTEAPVGSPAYMAPEQIRGEAVDERVDVYGLGVTLYQLLTARLPFTGSNGEQLRAAILAGVLRPLRAHNRTAPRDLEVVVAVALDRDRARRYGSMADFAGDLERVLAREPIRARPLGLGLRSVRFAQRHPSASVAAAALALALAVFPSVLWRVQVAHSGDLERLNAQLEQQRRAAEHSVQETRALNERLTREQSVAETSYHEALLAVHQMMVRTGSDDLVATPGSEALRIATLERSIAMYRRLGKLRPGDADLSHDVAVAAQHLGAVLMQVGATAEAQQRLQEGLDELVRSVAPRDDVVRAHLFKLLGQVQQVRGQVPAAVGSLRAAHCAMVRAAERAPNDRELRRQVAECQNSLALALRDAGDRAGWRTMLAEASATKSAMLAEAPRDPATVLAFVIGCVNSGQLAIAERRHDEALALLDRGVEHALAVVPPRVLSTRFRDKLGSLFDMRASLHQATGHFDEAIADHGVALALRQELAQEFPATAEYGNRVAGSLHNLARTLDDAGRDDEALSCEREAIAVQRATLRSGPGNREYALHLEYMLVGRCSLLLGMARPDELEQASAELQDGAVSAEGLLNAARAHVLLARQLAASDAARAQRARERSAVAVARAVDQGFRDLAHFERAPYDRHYRDLRGIAAYEQALQRLRTSGK